MEGKPYATWGAQAISETFGVPLDSAELLYSVPSLAGGVKLGFEANDYLSGNKAFTKENALNSTKEVGYSAGLGLATSGMPLAPAVGLSITGDWVKDGRYDVTKTYSSNVLGSIADNSLENSKFKSASPVIREFITNAYDKYYETKLRAEK